LQTFDNCSVKCSAIDTYICRWVPHYKQLLRMRPASQQPCTVGARVISSDGSGQPAACYPSARSVLPRPSVYSGWHLTLSWSRHFWFQSAAGSWVSYECDDAFETRSVVISSARHAAPVLRLHCLSRRRRQRRAADLMELPQQSGRQVLKRVPKASRMLPAADKLAEIAAISNCKSRPC
jgi:hypothetical protein